MGAVSKFFNSLKPGRSHRVRLEMLETQVAELQKQVRYLQDQVLYEPEMSWPMRRDELITLKAAVRAIYRHFGIIPRWTHTEARRVIADKPDMVQINTTVGEFLKSHPKKGRKKP